MRDRFLKAADDLSLEIWDHRRRARDGSVTWLRPGSASRGEPASLRVRVDPYLYDGSVGIALFLAALARVGTSGRHREQSLEVLAPVRRKAAELTAHPDRAEHRQGLGIGGFIGLGALLYAFLRIGGLLDEPALVEEARGLLVLLTPDRIARDTAGDVLYGSAGAILALLALHREHPGPGRDGLEPLEIASACARHLLARRQSFDQGPRTWRTLPGLPPLLGLSHGAGGICYALLRLYERTGEPEVLQAAREGIAFENTFYCPKERSWRDPRFAEPVFKTGWCNGAAGIALARLAALHVLDTPGLQTDVETALAATRAAPMTALDHICCGNLGRAEVLLEASARLGDEELGDAARALAWSTLRRAEDHGLFAWRHESEPGLFDPTFFTGASGAGYAFLRLADRDALPCVLLLD